MTLQYEVLQLLLSASLNKTPDSAVPAKLIARGQYFYQRSEFNRLQLHDYGGGLSLSNPTVTLLLP